MLAEHKDQHSQWPTICTSGPPFEGNIGLNRWISVLTILFITAKAKSA